MPYGIAPTTGRIVKHYPMKVPISNPSFCFILRLVLYPLCRK
jgi:hypothetical protein